MNKPIALLIGIVLLTPSVACATEGVFTMHGIKQKKYFQTADHEYRILYRLEAEKRISVKSKDALIKSMTHQGAREALYYQNGILQFNEVTIRFKLGYFHRGVLFLEHCQGHIGSSSFFAKEIHFDEQAYQLSANRITLSTNNQLAIRKGYQFTIPLHPIK
jgi:hypothetical protein